MLVESWCPNRIPCTLPSPGLLPASEIGVWQSSSQISGQFYELTFPKAFVKSFTDLLGVARVGNVNLGEDIFAGLLASFGFSLPEKLDVQSAFIGTVLVHLSPV